MKYQFALLLACLFSTMACGQRCRLENFLVAYIDSTSGEALTGYKSLDGRSVIKAKYRSGTDTLRGIAIVLTLDFKYIGIDKDDKMLLQPYMYDNGPDDVHEGLFRYVEDNKIGFANLEGQKTLKAKYDFASPFLNGIAEYYMGGEQIYEDGRGRSQIIKEDGPAGLMDRHWTWGGHVIENGYLNPLGQEFTEITKLKNNKRFAWTKDHRKFELNRKGQIIRELTAAVTSNLNTF